MMASSSRAKLSMNASAQRAMLVIALLPGFIGLGHWMSDPAHSGVSLALDIPVLLALACFARPLHTLLGLLISAISHTFVALHSGMDSGVLAQLYAISTLAALALAQGHARHLRAHCFRARHIPISSWKPARDISLLFLTALLQTRVLAPLHEGSDSAALAQQFLLNLFGTYIAANIVYPIIGRPRRSWNTHGTTLLGATLLATLLASLAFITVRVTHDHRLARQVQDDANRFAHFISAETDRIHLALNALAAFYRSSSEVSHEAFSRFAGSVLGQYSEIIALEWLSIVDHSERETFERKLGDVSGWASARMIWEPGDAETPRKPARQRDRYFPVTHIHPRLGHGSYVGYDFAFEPRRAGLVRRALNAPDSVVSQPLRARHDGSETFAYIEALHVPEHAGIALVTVNIDKLLTAAHRRDLVWADQLRVKVLSKVTDNTLLAQNQLPEHVPALQASADVKVADAGGTVVVTQARGQGAQWTLSSPIWVLIIGLIIGTGSTMQIRFLIVHAQQATRQTRAEHMYTRRLARMDRQMLRSEKMAALGSMVSGITHEVNSPLQTAVLALDRAPALLQQFRRAADESARDSLAERLERSLNSALRNVRRAGTLINDFKQMSSDATSERLSTFDLRELLDMAAELSEPSRRPRRAELIINCPRGIRMESHPGLLTQVIINLIENALMHAFPGRWSTPQLWLSARQETAKRVIISLRDNGVGVTEEMQGRMFEAYQTSKPDEGGTGLGLYLCKTIVRAKLHGQLNYRALPGGSQFDIDIPMGHES